MAFRRFLLPLMVGLFLWALGPLLGEDLLLSCASVLFFGALTVAAGPSLDRLLAEAVAEVHGLFGRLLQRRLHSFRRLVGTGRRLLRLLQLLRRLGPLLLQLVVRRPAAANPQQPFGPLLAATLGAAATAGSLLRRRLVMAALRQRLPAVRLLLLRLPLVA